MLEKVKKEELWETQRKMAKIRIANEILANHYKKDMKLMGYGPQQQKIFKGIRECKTNFYEYYVKHKGKLNQLYSNPACKNISSKTLSLIERLIEEITGTIIEEKTETVKNKSAGFVIGMRHYKIIQ